MKIGDEIYVHGYVEEIRQDKVIIRNDGGYFRTVLSEMREATQEERESVDEYISRISEDVPDIGVGKNYNPKGRTESSMTILGDVLKEAYCSGYTDGLSDRIESDYDRGLHDAWEAARKICAGNFAGKLDTGMILNISASDAIEKIKEYEAEERVKDWHDIPAEEMTEDQLRQAVKDLRKIQAEERGIVAEDERIESDWKDWRSAAGQKINIDAGIAMMEERKRNERQKFIQRMREEVKNADKTTNHHNDLDGGMKHFKDWDS